MGGGGFMQHASDTNRKDRAQKAARREKFSGNHSDKTILDDANPTKLDFSHLTPEEITQERLRIKNRSAQRKKKTIVTTAISMVVTAGIFFLLYYVLVR